MAKQKKKKKIEIIEATENSSIILVAPHGFPGNDDNCGQLTRKISKLLGCYAVINEDYPRNEINLNDLNEIIGTNFEETFLRPILDFKEAILKKHSNATIIHIHGKEDVDKNDKYKKYEQDICIGMGLPKKESPEEKDGTLVSLSAPMPYTTKLRDLLNQTKVKTEITRSWKYAAIKEKTLNQLFTKQNLYDPAVASVQLEIRKKDYRDTTAHVTRTAKILSKIFRELSLVSRIDKLLPSVAIDESEQNANTDIKNILIIAPNAHPDDGKDIDKIAELMLHELSGDFKCKLIVNTEYRIPQVKQLGLTTKSVKRRLSFEVISGLIPSRVEFIAINEKRERLNKTEKILNWKSIKHATKYLQQELIEPIDEFLKEPGKSILFWINGTTDEEIWKERRNGWSELSLRDKLRIIDEKHLSGVIGDLGLYRSGETKYESVFGVTLDRFCSFLDTNKEHKINLRKNDVVKLKVNSPQDDMNQWCLQQGYNIEKVQSIQISLRKSGIRDNPVNIEKTGRVLADALRKTCRYNIRGENSIDSKLVKEASQEIIDIYNQHFEWAISDIGKYLIDTFYDGSYQRARLHQPTKDKSLKSLAQTIRKSNPDAPSQSWIYRTVQLEVEDHYIKKVFPESLFYTYRNLLLSHKVLLFPVDNMSVKQDLVKEISEKKYTVRQLRNRLAQLNIPRKKSPTLLSLISKPSQLFDDEHVKLLEGVEQLPESTRKKLQEGAVKKMATIKKSIQRQQKAVDDYEVLLGRLEKAE